MIDPIICGQCPKVYDPREIDALLGGERVASLAELRSLGTAHRRRPPRARKLLRGFAGMSATATVAKGPDLDVVDQLKAYTFCCPEGHEVSGNPGSQLGVAVLGASGSSKTHMLPAIVRELDDMSRLRAAGVTLSDPLYPNPKLTQDVVRLYRRGERLEPTSPGAMHGPYGYKMLVEQGTEEHDPRLYSLLLYDIAGEDLENVARIAENASFILLCRAIIVLIDPTEILPTQFDSAVVANERARVDAGRDIRGGIRVIADTLTQVWHLGSSRSLEIPICFAIAKADAVDWTGGFDWAEQTWRVLAGAQEGEHELRDALHVSSNETREAFVRMGGRLVVEEIESFFAAPWIRYAAASATCAMPEAMTPDRGIGWTQYPEPNGAALSILHLLDMAHVLPRQPAYDDDDGA